MSSGLGKRKAVQALAEHFTEETGNYRDRYTKTKGTVAQQTFFRHGKCEVPVKSSLSLPKSPVEDREYIDSEGSLHMMGRTSLKPEEMKTVKNDRRCKRRSKSRCDSLSQRLRHLCVRQVGTGFSSGTVFGNVMRHSGLLLLMESRRENVTDPTGSHSNVDRKNRAPVVAVTKQAATPARENAGGTSLSDWLQPAEEDTIHEPLASNLVRGNSSPQEESYHLPHVKKNDEKRTNNSNPTSTHHVFTHFPRTILRKGQNDEYHACQEPTSTRVAQR